jgi:hypothetical protein
LVVVVALVVMAVRRDNLEVLVVVECLHVVQDQELQDKDMMVGQEHHRKKYKGEF